MESVETKKVIADMAGEFAEIAARYTLDIGMAILILVAGFIFAGMARRWTVRNLAKLDNFDDTLEPFIANVVRYAVLILVFVAVLAQFGVQTTSIIAILGAAGLAIGLALQGTLANIAAGIMLLFLRPFQIGDYIDAEGVAGTVEEIGLFTTQMKTFDGIYTSVPNANVWNRTIHNFSRNPSRRLDIAVGVGYGDDLNKAKSVLEGIIEKEGRVLDVPAPLVIVKSLDDSAVTLELRVWTSISDFWGLKWDMTQAIKEFLDEAKVSIPFPQRDVHLYQT